MKSLVNVFLFSFLSLFLLPSCSKDQTIVPGTSSNSIVTYWDNNSYCLVLDEAGSYATLYERVYTVNHIRYMNILASTKYSLSGDRILFNPSILLHDFSIESAQFDETKSHLSLIIGTSNLTLSRSVVPPSGFYSDSK